ncbi:DNA-dependent RNA polymerase subunit epsilon [Bacillaceae bacterium W0354]
MIYKVLYQEKPDEAPVREQTKSLYLEADSVREVRQKLADRNINIEYVQPLSEAHLAYEEQSEHFNVEKI